MSLRINNLGGFGGGGAAAAADITVTDITSGWVTPSSGQSGATHTYNQVDTSGGDAIAFVTCNSSRTLTATWSGAACTVLKGQADNTSTWIISCPGAQTGDLIISWSAACSGAVCVIQLNNCIDEATPTYSSSSIDELDEFDMGARAYSEGGIDLWMLWIDGDNPSWDDATGFVLYPDTGRDVDAGYRLQQPGRANVSGTCSYNLLNWAIVGLR